MTILRLASPPKDRFYRLSRQNILPFIMIAGWLHFCLFLGLERFEPDILNGSIIPAESLSLPMELTLEISPDAFANADMPLLAQARPETPLGPASGTPLEPPLALPLENLNPLPAEPPYDPASPQIPIPIPAAALPYTDPPPADRPLSPEELLDPADNQIKTFSFSEAGELLEGDESFTQGADNTVNVEENAPKLKSYESQVRTAVARHWILPPAARTNFQPGRFSASMTLSQNGEITSIVVRESAGNTTWDYAAMEALRGAAPYPPFPEELSHLSERTFHIHFDYRAVVRTPSAARNP
jgi:protein TonB